MIRKVQRSGYRLHWNVSEYPAAAHRTSGPTEQQEDLPILATDRNYRNILDSKQLRREWDRLLMDLRGRPADPVPPRPVYQEAG